MTFKSALRSLLPPLLAHAASRVKRFFSTPVHDWTYHREGWGDERSLDAWADPSIMHAQLERWPAFVAAVRSTAPLGLAYEHPGVPVNDSWHNNTMIFGYVLGRAAGSGRELAVLDWGGSIGHHFVLARALRPDLQLDYHVLELASVCDAGAAILPEVTFHRDRSSIDRTFDLVMASGSLQCIRDWKSEMRQLASLSTRFVFVTRLPTVTAAQSFVAVQRAHRYGYQTDFFVHVVNRGELVEAAESLGLTLVREFRLQEAPYIHDAPEQARSAGYLFERMPAR